MGQLLCKKIYGTFGVEMRAYGQKLVKFCKHTDTHKISSREGSISAKAETLSKRFITLQITLSCKTQLYKNKNVDYY